MFYLEHFFRLLLSSPVKGVVLILSQVLLVILLMNQSFFESKFIAIQEKPEPRYFYSIFSELEVAQKLELRLKKLPGISKVEVIEDTVEEKDLSILSEELQDFVSKTMTNTKYFSLKIEVEEKLGQRSENLLRGFIKDFDTSSFLGSTETVGEKAREISFWEKYIFYELLAVAFSFWLLLIFANTDQWRNYFYVISRSTRAKLAGLKIVSVGFVTFWAIGSLLGVSFPQSNLKISLLFLPFLLIAILFFYKSSFNRGVK
jgi:hypothetical protein